MRATKAGYNLIANIQTGTSNEVVEDKFGMEGLRIDLQRVQTRILFRVFLFTVHTGSLEMEKDMHPSSFSTGDQVLLDNLNVEKYPRLDAQAILQLAVICFTLDEQESQERSEKDRLAILEKETLEDDYRQRLEILQDYYKQLQDDYEDIDAIERCRLKRARNLALAVGSSVSTQQSVQRRMWIRLRSQAWWEKCNHPAFPVAEFHKSFRMSKQTFEHICMELKSVIGKENTTLRQAVPVSQRVAVCIWRLATGEPLRLVAKRFGLGISTCHTLVLEVCAAINDVLLPKYVQWPSEEKIANVMVDYENISGIQNIVGAIYTTHLPISAPKANVAAYFNKRHTEKNRRRTAYSITLQGTVDTKGSFTDVCIGWPGSMTDERVLQNSALYQRGTSGSLQGCWVAGDSSFPLLDWLLVPYATENISWAQQTFNEKVEEALKVAKDAFGRLKGRWKFLQKRTEVRLQELPAVLGACCVLHNICEQRNESFSPDLAFEVFDDLTPVENATWPMHALQSRDAIAQSLLHQVQLSAAFL